MIAVSRLRKLAWQFAHKVEWNEIFFKGANNGIVRPKILSGRKQRLDDNDSFVSKLLIK